jgi:hypothetical protein
VRPDEGRLTEPTAATQPWWRELVFMPHYGPWQISSWLLGVARLFDDYSDLRFVIFAKRFSRAARIDAGDDCIAARIGIAIERLSRSGAGV